MRSKDKKYHLLYKTTNLLNDTYYYGIHSTNRVEDGYLGSGKRLRHSIRKYGKENFKREILKFFDNREKLVQAEIEIITETILRDKNCMNINFGGEKWNTIGMITVKDQNSKIFKVFKDDPRYLSGELKHHLTGFLNVKDKEGNILSVSINDPRYLSGELLSLHKNKFLVKDGNGSVLKVTVNDVRFLSGELIPLTKGFITVKDKDENTLKVLIDDPRYLSGELKPIWSGKKHSNETKNKIGQANSINQKGDKNSQFGTCWITKDNENKKIKKEELDSYIQLGWSKGRKLMPL